MGGAIAGDGEGTEEATVSVSTSTTREVSSSFAVVIAPMTSASVRFPCGKA